MNAHPDIRALRRGCLIAAAVYAVLIAYGSLVPLDFQPCSLAAAWAKLRASANVPFAGLSRSDLAVNGLLLMPLALLLMTGLTLDRPGWWRWLAPPAALIACALTALGVELLQALVPQRVPSLFDVAAQTLGAAVAVLLSLCLGPALAALATRTRLASSLWPAAAYAVVLLVAHWMPFDAITSPVELYRKWRRGDVEIVPAIATFDDWQRLLAHQTLTLAYFVPLGLAVGMAAVRRTPPLTTAQLLLVGLAAASVVELGQLFVESRHVVACDLLSGTLGFCLGAAIARSLLQPTLPLGAARWGAVAAAWIGLLCATQWMPFNFQGDRATCAARLRYAWQAPFAELVAGSYVGSFLLILDKLILFVVFGALAAVFCLACGLNPFWPVVLAALAAAVVLEAGQLLLPTRYPTTADILLGTLGGALGAMHPFQLQRKHRAAHVA